MTRRKRFWLGLGAAALCLFASQIKAQEQNLAAIYAPDALRAAYARESRDWQPLPPWTVQAFLMAEDRQFFDGKAAWRSAITHSVSQWFPEPSGRRQLVPVLAIGSALSKTEILNLLVQQVYLGRGCHGVRAAAQTYFGKNAENLNLHEAALLAALVRQPIMVDSPQHQTRLRQRRDGVLSALVEARLILPQEARQAMARPLGLSDPSHRCPPMQDEKPVASGEKQRVILQP